MIRCEKFHRVHALHHEPSYPLPWTMHLRPLALKPRTHPLNQLGMVHLERTRGDRPENLANAIESFQKCLEVYTEASNPLVSTSPSSPHPRTSHATFTALRGIFSDHCECRLAHDPECRVDVLGDSWEVSAPAPRPSLPYACA